jgi:hypothetical protein
MRCEESVVRNYQSYLLCEFFDSYDNKDNIVIYQKSQYNTIC